ncbi:MAG TPA: FeoA family protein [Thermoguttaceae bacterium]|nr:FeoA family protein [Thermoguttaceae bacterium]HPP53908.1 FeoA family protein [Thermoguttaceae bacterium]
MNPLIPLPCCPEGRWVRIEAMDGPPAEIHRLRELGLRPGRRFEVFRCGNPCILQIDGHKLCLRCGPGVQVLVQPEQPLPGADGAGSRGGVSSFGRFRWRRRGR